MKCPYLEFHGEYNKEYCKVKHIIVCEKRNQGFDLNIRGQDNCDLNEYDNQFEECHIFKVYESAMKIKT